MSKEFVLKVGEESAVVVAPDGFKLAEILDAIMALGCTLKQPEPEVERELEPHEELGMSYCQWFRMYVSGW